MLVSLKRWLLCTIGGQVGILTLIMLTASAVVMVLAWWLQGLEILRLVAIAAGVCYIAAIIALVGERWFAAHQLTLMGLGWAMAFRTGVPLAAALALLARGGPLVTPWIICYLGVFYLIALTVHVVLSYRSLYEAQPLTKRDDSKNYP
jgi:hypothetical protein